LVTTESRFNIIKVPWEGEEWKKGFALNAEFSCKLIERKNVQVFPSINI